jgi:hypothetical protein
VRLRWLLAVALGALFLALAATWLGMSAALVLALEPVRALHHILTSIGA